MVCIAHISDIHFGAVDMGAAERLAAELNEKQPDAIILTGDLTQSGRKREFRAAANYLDKLTPPLLVVPGNHDAPVYNLGQRLTDPWKRFREFIHHDLRPVLRVKDVMVAGLNSARRANASLDWSLGRLSSDQIDHAAKTLRRADDAGLRLVAFHHPAVPGPGRAGQAVINRPARALSAFAAAGADVILTGHAHIANAEVIPAGGRQMLVAAAGTAASTRTRGEGASYNLLRWREPTLSVEVFRYQSNSFSAANGQSFVRRDGDWRAA